MPTLIENRTLEDNVAMCAGLGLSFVELNMNFPEYQVARLEQTDELLRLGEQAGVYFTIHLDENLNVADFNPLVVEAYRETVRRTVALAKALLPLRDRFGNSAQPLTLNMHMHHGIHITLPDRKVQMYDRDFDAYMASFAAFRSLCEAWIGDSPLRIVIENTDGFRAYERRASGTCPSFLPMRIGCFTSTSTTAPRPRPGTTWPWATAISTSRPAWPWPGVGAPAVSWRPRLWRP